MKKTDVYIWCCGMLLFSFVLQSCSREEAMPENQNHQFPAEQKTKNKQANEYFSKPEPVTFSLSERFQNEALVAEPCETTDFGIVLSGYFESIMNDPVFDFDLLNYYLELNRKYVTFYMGDNYYGENGEYNQLAAKRIRELEKFWNIDRDIYLNGQHTSLLNDREILADMIESFDRTVRNRTEAYQKADLLLELNETSSNFPENPYFAFDGFTRSSGLLVIGDGLLQSIIETGIDGDLAFTAILSHEWWHQAQFEYAESWDFSDQLAGPAEFSRYSELEADYAAAYYLTHKRGATFNWKRIEEYFKLSFNVGDCLTESMDHHGTPTQRLLAAQLGYELADTAHKKGAILEPSQVHYAFLEDYYDIIK
ncbi:hypothetical protein [Christiangramia sp. SM2212]|uniref:Uncharacterized protein n=1 Tax=Christiangramia sediminicola TaxID=3073267 RepID=A0ABU1ER50_9FLAO|nr:hypothetical protein [Christiangramia sp. SM2212]MDR5590857.1 hypothetical protein [Christiangramia sp. SM2212]